MSEQLNEIITTPAAGFGAAVLGAVGLWAANRVLGKAAFQDAITSGFAELHKQEEAARISLQTQLTALRAELSEERQSCQRQLNRMAHIIGGLKLAMRQSGVPVPDEGVLLQEGVDGLS